MRRRAILMGYGKKRIMVTLAACAIVLSMVLGLCACSGGAGSGQAVNVSAADETLDYQENDDFTFLVYTKNGSGTELMSYSYTTSETEFESRFELMTDLLVQMPPEPGQVPAIPSYLERPDFSYSSRILYINFGSEYYEMDRVTEVLCRAAIVSTMCQLPEVDYVFFRVNGVSLLDSDGDMVGYMKASDFIQRATDMNDVVTETVRLYFANQDGTALVGTETPVTYASNSTPERAVVEAIIDYGANDGYSLFPEIPSNSTDLRPTVPPTTEIYSVQVRGGICYVNLSSTFADQSMNMDPALTIFSLVNSLTGLDTVERVQIMVEGDSSIVFRDSVPLEAPFTADDSLVER